MLFSALSSFPRPITLFCDSSVFGPSRIEFVRALLEQTPVWIVEEALTELWDLVDHAKTPEERELAALLFPGGSLHERVRVHSLRPYFDLGLGGAVSYYVNLLHHRRKVLEGPLEQYRVAHGRDATGKDRARVVRALAETSSRTTKLATRGDPRRRYTDEVTVVAAATALLHGTSEVMVLTFDSDLFEQFYKLTSLLRDDYLSMLCAGHHSEHPSSFPARLPLPRSRPLERLVADFGASFAVELPKNPWVLLPRMLDRPPGLLGFSVVCPAEEGHGLTWVALDTMVDVLHMKARARGRNTDRHGSLNCYANLQPCIPNPGLPRGKPFLFFVADRLVRFSGRNANVDGGFDISCADALRTLVDHENPEPDGRLRQALPPAQPRT